jgi:murein DD-endopeptidase MepM/ murein hydrolase activator NlpD
MAVEITKMNFPGALDVEYSAKSLVPEGFTFSPTLVLAPRSVGLVDDYYLTVRSRPDQLRITARGRDDAGVEYTGILTVPIRTYQSRNSYAWPLEPGEWFVLAFPGLHSHHRWTATTEHAFDITMVDSRGSWARGGAADWRTGNVARWEDWYAYNKKVLAAAAGVVVKVVDDVEFPLAFWNRRAGETLEAYRERIGQRQMELFTAPGADAMSVAGGNHVVIRHANGEYSFYAHLAYGSIRVKAGQAVAQGEHIAGVGGTGEAPAVHLHFQVSDSPSMSDSRTFPVHFSNIHVNEAFADSFEPKLFFQPGFFITTARLPE